MDQIRASSGILGGALSQLGGAFGGVGSVITGFAGAGVAGAAIAAVGQVAQGLQWSIKEATESEQAFKNLAEAVRRSGTAWESVRQPTEEFLSQMQRVTTYSDEALAGMVERLLTFGMTYDDAMQAAGAAVDLAAAKHMDLQSAADVVGKAFMGNTALLKRYGIDIEEAGGKSATFTDVLKLLNEQFGGAAQEQAKTYAGVQERLKNATSELGEKIGGMLLPALTSITEAMIPVVDWFGKGIDSVQAWLTEVGKMPEVKGFVDAAQGAFDGLWKAMEDFWGFLAETFGPVLQELGAAFKEVFDALAPIGEAIGEVWAAIVGGEGSGDWLKDFLKFVAQFIREVVVPAIKETVPVIRGFAEAFKAAADFALPIITEIRDAVVGFINALKEAFYGFYTWLVGGSLWMDMWNQLLAVAGTMITQLLGQLGAQLFEPIKTAFTGAMQAVEDIWNTGWGAVQSGLSGALSAAQGILQGGIDTMWGMWDGFVKGIGEGIQQIKNVFGQVAGALAGAGQEAGGAMQTVGDAVSGAAEGAQSATQGAMSAVASTFQNAFNTVATAATNFYNWLVGGSLWTDMLSSMQFGTDTAFAAIQASAYNFFLLLDTVFTEGMAALDALWSTGWLQAQDLAATVWSQVESIVVATMAAIVKEMEASMAKLVQVTQAELTVLLYVWQSIFSNMGIITSITMSQIIQTMQTALQRIRELAVQIRFAMVTGSIWPDMLNEMQSQTETAMGNIVGAFRRGFENITLEAAYTRPPVPAAARERSATEGEAYPGFTSQAISIPVNVQVDGQTIARLVEDRMIYTRWARGRGFEA